MSLSIEQRAIVDNILTGNNVYSDSVPGAGKTTTAIQMAIEVPHCCLILTFSTDLKEEGRQKKRKYKLRNLEVESYNSLCLNYYGKGGLSSVEVEEVVNTDAKPIKRSPPFKILVLDETQDMSHWSHSLVQKFVKDMKLTPQYLVIGDKYQSIFEFLGSDRRYLSLCDTILQKPFTSCPLTRSFRMTDPMSQFVNRAILGEERIRTMNPSPYKVQYVIAESYRQRFYANYIKQQIEMLIRTENATAEDFFFLLPTLKGGYYSPASLIDRMLTQMNMLVMYADSINPRVTSRHLKQKAVITTYHKSKGRERPFVFVFGCDQKYYGTIKEENIDYEKCLPQHYVPFTRATKCLYLIQDSSSTQLSYFKMPLTEIKESCSDCVEIHNMTNKSLEHYNKVKPIKEDKKRNLTVTTMLEYLPSDCETILKPLVESMYSEVYNSDGRTTRFEPDIRGISGTLESVSHLNGMAFPPYIFHRLGYESKIHRDLQNQDRVSKCKLLQKINTPPDTIQDHLRYANYTVSKQRGTSSNLRQIYGYNWLTRDNVACCLDNSERITRFLTQDTCFEQGVNVSINHKTYGEIKISGYIDSINQTTIFEYKCKSVLSNIDKLQLIVYCWIQEKTNGLCETPYLFNFFTGELLQLRYNPETVDKIMEILFKEKLEFYTKISDAEFVDRNKHV